MFSVFLAIMPGAIKSFDQCKFAIEWQLVSGNVQFVLFFDGFAHVGCSRTLFESLQ